MSEAVSVVEDFRAGFMGCMRTALDLWEIAIIATLLYNASTWTDMSVEAENKLEDLQLFYLRLVLGGVPQSGPPPRCP